MSFLRRRILGDPSPSPPPSLPSTGGTTPTDGEEVRLVPLSKLRSLTSRKPRKRRNWIIFGLGGLFGIVVAAFFANQQDVINLEGLLDINLESLLDVIPAGVVRDAKELTVGSFLAREGIDISRMMLSSTYTAT